MVFLTNASNAEQRCVLFCYPGCIQIYLHIEAETRSPPFRRWRFQKHFLERNVWILLNISLKFVPENQINNIPSLVQIMAWRRSGDKPLSEPMMVWLPTYICVTQPQWVNNAEKCVYIKWNGVSPQCICNMTVIVKLCKVVSSAIFLLHLMCKTWTVHYCLILQETAISSGHKCHLSQGILFLIQPWWLSWFLYAEASRNMAIHEITYSNIFLVNQSF